MKKLLLCLGLVAFMYPLSCIAQTPKENLEKGVEIYNALREYVKTLNAKTVNNENINDIKDRINNGSALLEKVVKEGNADQIKAARYFKTMFNYELGFVLGMKGENNKAYDVFIGIEKDITAYKATDFPLKYEFFNKNFKISWDNFAPTQAEYYTGMAEISYNLSKYEDAIRINKYAIEHPKLTSWLKYISINKMLDIRAKKTSLLSDEDYWEYAAREIKAYADLKEEDHKVIEENKYPTAERGAKILIAQQSNIPTEKMVKYATEAAPQLTNLKLFNQAIQLYNYALEKSASLSISFHQDALRAAREAKKTIWNDLSATEKATAKSVALLSIAQLIPSVGTDCEKIAKYADDYSLFDETQKANEIRSKTAKCLEERKKKQEKEAEERRKEEQRRKKENYKREHPFNMYVGIDVLPLLTSPQKMDFGGHIDFRGRTVAHSFGGSLVKAKKDLISGRETWDGYKAFYALKMFGSKQSITYTGLYLGYANKNFDTIPVVMKTIASNPKVTNFNINMRDIQYEAMWNAGMQVLGKGLGVDMYLGIGASYNKLSSTNSDAYNKPTEFSIQDDNGTDFFSKRKKQTSWNMRLRAGITIGLNMGPKRM